MKIEPISIEVYCEECSEELKARVVSRHPSRLEIIVEGCEKCYEE